MIGRSARIARPAGQNPILTTQRLPNRRSAGDFTRISFIFLPKDLQIGSSAGDLRPQAAGRPAGRFRISFPLRTPNHFFCLYRQKTFHITCLEVKWRALNQQIPACLFFLEWRLTRKGIHRGAVLISHRQGRETMNFQ